MTHFLDTQDWSRADLDSLLEMAGRLRESPAQKLLEGRSIALLFLNPSLRTSTSFQVGAARLGATAVVLQPGRDAWPIEFDFGTVMDGAAEEHIAEVAGVLSAYCDLIGLRAFPRFEDWAEERQDRLIGALARYASVPVINMETIVHPCQELALMRTVKDRLGPPAGRNFLLTWCWHPKPLNMAVANSALTIASRFAMNVTLLCPGPEWRLDDRYMARAAENVKTAGGSLRVTHDIDQAYRGADFVYAKSWGCLAAYGNPERQTAMAAPYRHFIVDEAKMDLTNDAWFSHCLPLRRNVKATDGVMESPRCVALAEAANRLPVQQALMLKLLGHGIDNIALPIGEEDKADG